jgi:hypothetical protein
MKLLKMSACSTASAGFAFPAASSTYGSMITDEMMAYAAIVPQPAEPEITAVCPYCNVSVSPGTQCNCGATEIKVPRSK